MCQSPVLFLKSHSAGVGESQNSPSLVKSSPPLRLNCWAELESANQADELAEYCPHGAGRSR
jgi:hypothetical protein